VSSAHSPIDPTHEALIDDDGIPCPVVHFDWNAVSGEPVTEDQVPVATAASAIMRILDWLTASRNFHYTGTKTHMLRTLLDPINGEFRTMAEIARAGGISRAALSKAFTDLRDTYGIRLCGGKLNSSRAIYREAQLRLAAEHHHASDTVRKNSTDPSRGNPEMNPPKTLDAARNEIARLEAELATVTALKPAPATLPPPKAVIPTPIKPAQTPHSAPKLEDLNRLELTQILDVAQRRGDQALVATVYAELNRRRRN
jgi:hypothetical protein